MSVLNLNIAKLAGPGRLPLPLEAEYVRDITEADLAIMAVKPLGSMSPALKRITDRHHSLARLLASGVSEGEAAMITGYDVSRVSILKNSPAFQELLALYQSEVKREFVTTLEHMAGIARDAALILRERMEENPDRFTNSELVKMNIDMADRTTEPPGTVDLPEIIELTAPTSAPRVSDSAPLISEPLALPAPG